MQNPLGTSPVRDDASTELPSQLASDPATTFAGDVDTPRIERELDVEREVSRAVDRAADRDTDRAFDAARETDQGGEDERIRGRAYELYLQRGDGPGSDLDDWLQAEREIRHS